MKLLEQYQKHLGHYGTPANVQVFNTDTWKWEAHRMTDGLVLVMDMDKFNFPLEAPEFSVYFRKNDMMSQQLSNNIQQTLEIMNDPKNWYPALPPAVHIMSFFSMINVG